MKKEFLILFFVLVSSTASEATTPPIPYKVGMSKEEIYKIFPKKNTRTYLTEGSQKCLTLPVPRSTNVWSFCFQDEKLVTWKSNDREEVIREYLGEFCSSTIRHNFPNIHTAIKNVLLGMPWEDFLKVTDRKQPVLFTEFFDSGTAQFASSSEIISLPDDVPAFQNGFTLLKISTGLEQAGDPKAIEGVIAHEVAHKVLDHVRTRKTTCDAEREANQLIKTWGFAESYQKASAEFGHAAHGDGPNPCADK